MERYIISLKEKISEKDIITNGLELKIEQNSKELQ